MVAMRLSNLACFKNLSYHSFDSIVMFLTVFSLSSYGYLEVCQICIAMYLVEEKGGLVFSNSIRINRNHVPGSLNTVRLEINMFGY